MTSRFTFFTLLIALLAPTVLTACGDGEGDASPSQTQFDKARAWVDRQSGTIQNIGEMIDAYERNDMQRAAAEMDSLRGVIDWENLGGPEMRDRILTIGTEVYAALDRPEDAARLIENALPHLDGELRTQWEELRTRLASGTIPADIERALQEEGKQEAAPRE